MFLPWRDHSFLFDEDDVGKVTSCDLCLVCNQLLSALWEEINNPVEVVTGALFRETGEEVFTDHILLFDNIPSADETPNHLLLLYLNLGVFLLIVGIIFFFKQFNIVILCIVMIVMGVINIGLQVTYLNILN